MYKSYFKRVIDIVVSLVGLLISLPVLLLLLLMLYIANRGKVWFVQERPGKENKIFKVIKLKTMNDKRDAYGNLLSDAERLTVIGRFIRKSSLDELPQLWNVLKGDMSLVGPRPLLVQYLPLYNQKQARRHEVRPGITGWAQVNGRNALSWEEKFELDVWYVDHLSCWLDVKIMLLTIKKVFIREGISAQGHVTMDYFRGSQQ